MPQLREVLTSGKFRRTDEGRYFVLLSLAEAETIRCILHMRRGRPLVQGGDVSLALRCVPADDAVFDCSENYVAAPPYQRSVAHACFRFVDSAMHFKPADLNVLLRSIHAPPAQRRLFFQMAVACRRRLAKRWEQTPLAKLFTLQDEWSMLKQRAQAVRVREAIKARGLLLHDAFQKFDYDRNGLLSLAEVYGALDWLEIPGVLPAEVIFFVRSISQEPHISYAQFMDILVPPEEHEALMLDGGRSGEEAAAAALLADDGAANGDVDGGGGAIVEVARGGSGGGGGGGDGGGAVVPMPTRQRSRVPPKGEALLEEMLAAQITREQSIEAELESTERAQIEAARAYLEQQMVDSDFSWMRQSKRGGATNPRTTRTSCFYDFGRGAAVGTQRGAPMWCEARGKWLGVRQGKARVPAFKGVGATMVVLRAPFRKNAGGMHLNQYTVTMQVRFRHLASRGLLCTAGWDQWTKVGDGDDDAQLFLDADGGVGAHGSFGDGSSPRCRAHQWHTITCTVDCVGGVVRTYVDGREAAECRSAKVCKDGQHALKGRLALFYARNKPCERDFYLRSATLHNRVLDHEQVRKEHAMLEEMLLEDAIEATPSFFRAPLVQVMMPLPLRTAPSHLPPPTPHPRPHPRPHPHASPATCLQRSPPRRIDAGARRRPVRDDARAARQAGVAQEGRRRRGRAAVAGAARRRPPPRRAARLRAQAARARRVRALAAARRGRRRPRRR